MKIKVAVLDSDKLYLNRLILTFSNKYSDKIEMYSFTNKEVALANLEKEKVDVFISNAEFDIEVENLPKKCAFSYFVETSGVEKVKNERAICKYQNIDLIYKEILVIFSDKASYSTSINIENSNETVFIVFSSAAGGTGNSTVAVSYAKYLAKKGNKVLYLNFESLGVTNLMLSGEGSYNFSDVIYALKSKKANVSMKLESYIKTDSSNVCFYDTANNPLDILELNEEDVTALLNTLKIIGNFKYIIIDRAFSVDSIAMHIYKEAYKIIFVSNGSIISNTKTNSAKKILQILEANKDIPLTRKLAIIYNKFSNKTGSIIEDDSIQTLGGFPNFEKATTEQVINELSSSNKFDSLLK